MHPNHWPEDNGTISREASGRTIPAVARHPLPEPDTLLPGSTTISLISNRNSGHNRDHFNRVEQIVGQCRNAVHYPTSSPEEIPAVLRAIATKPPDILAINGGDGTAAHIFAQLLDHSPFDTLPLIALLPGGTANMTAGDIGLKGSLVPALQRLCKWSDSGASVREQTVQRFVLQVSPGHQQPPRYGMFFGAGAIIQGTEYAHRNIHSRGLRDDFSLGLSMVRTLWGIARGDLHFDRPLPVELSLDEAGEWQCHDIRIFAVSSLERLFMGIHPFWGAGKAPLKISFICRSARHFLLRFPGLLWGRPGRGAEGKEGYHSHTAQSLQLLMDGSFNLDGEIITAHRKTGPVTISAAGPLSFLKLP